MIPKQAIEKAIEEGWRPTFLALPHLHPERDWQHITLDPSFWQALGKALGWGVKCPLNHTSEYMETKPYNGVCWNCKAHTFYDLLLTGGDTEKFWKEII